MRIGIVTQSYLPIHGGVAQHAYHQMKELERRGHDVWVITTNYYRSDEQFNHRTIRIGRDLTIPGYGAFVNVTVGWNLARDLAVIEAEKKFDIVHIHNPLVPMLPMTALKTIRAPMVGTFHSYHPSCWPYQLFQSKLKRDYFSRLSGFITVSEAARTFYNRYFPGDYRVIPNGVDIERFHPDRKPLRKYQDGSFNIVFIGRMDPRKGLRHLITAFEAVVVKKPKTRLIVVGGGVLRHYYQSLVSREIRERVKFVGYISEEELPHYYRTADIFVSPATGNESFGIVLLEGLASGVPVVASDIPGYRTVIKHGANGILTPPAKPAALARVILSLIENQAERRRLSTSGRKSAEVYAWPKVVGKIEEYYHEVLNR